jgi:tetratricopeptide (TPR) repeat protein
MSAVEQQSGCRRAVSVLAGSVEWKFETEDYTFRWSFLSHVHACLWVYDGKDEEFDDDTMHEWSVMALILGENGSTRDALQLTQQVVELRKSKLGEDHPEILGLMHNLAIWYSKTGRRDEALKLTRQVVELCKSKLGDDHPDILRLMHNLAIWYSETGRRNEALKLTQQVVELYKSKLGDDHLNTLWLMHNLAIQYR